MAGFIKDYLNNLRHSDESTKHRSALTISIIASVIILSILFVIFKDVLFFRNKNVETSENIEVTTTTENKIESPLTSFKNFFRETGTQFSSLKSMFSDIPEVFQKGEEESVSTSTNETQIYTPEPQIYE